MAIEGTNSMQDRTDSLSIRCRYHSYLWDCLPFSWAMCPNDRYEVTRGCSTTDSSFDDVV